MLTSQEQLKSLGVEAEDFSRWTNIIGTELKRLRQEDKKRLTLEVSISQILATKGGQQ